MARLHQLGGLALGVVTLGCGGLVPDAGDPAPPPQAIDVPEPAPSLQASNVLVIVANDLGTDKVASYGEHPDAPATPHLDALAAEGVLFENAYAYAASAPSRAALLTGRYGRRTGIGGALQAGQELDLREITIPEMLALAPRPWSSAALGTWGLTGPNPPSGPMHPNDQGFGHFSGTLGDLDPAATDTSRGGYFESEIVVNGESQVAKGYATTRTTDDAVEQLNRLQSPWFLYVAYNAPHEPLHAPPEALGGRPLTGASSDADKIDAAIEALDTEIGRLMAAMSPRQKRETVVVFVGANGTARGAVRPPWDAERARNSLYEGGTNVPLIVRGPGVAVGQRAGALVHIVDLFPTFAALANVDIQRLSRDGAPLVVDGRSLTPVLTDPSAPGRSFVYTELFSPSGPGPYELDWVAVRDDRFKLLDVGGRLLSLFDLEGRSDDGDALRKTQLTPAETERYDVLLQELDRIAVELR